MSKVYQVDITCPKCAVSYDQSLFQTLWIEEPKNRALVFDDRVNFGLCPHCGFEVKVVAPLMCTNVPQKFAVWFEPTRTKLVDDYARQFSEMMGPTSFYATAPRVSDWEQFKRTIERFERGELKGGDPNLDVAAFRRALADAAQPKTTIFQRLFGKK